MINSPRARVSLGGTQVPIETLTVKMGSYGSIGTFDITCSISRLRSQSIDIYKIVSSGTPSNNKSSPTVLANVYVSADGKEYTELIQGDVDEVQWEYDKDHLSISGRDLGGRLYDSSFVLKGSQITNRTPIQIAQSFASDFGLSFVGPSGSAAAESTIGYKYLANEALKSLAPIRRWDYLVELARNVGYQVYVTPKGQLVFAPPDQSKQPLTYTWFADPHDTKLSPIKDLCVKYSPRRNKTFQVLVLSYHPKTTSLVEGTTIVIDQAIPIFANKTVKEGFWHGAGGASIRSAVGQRLEGKPVYIFYVQGLTPEECQDKADAVAKEIAAREYNVEGTVTSDARLMPNSYIKLDGPVDNFKGIKLMVSTVTYEFSLHAGLQAKFTALYIPPEPQALSVDPFG